MLFNQVFDIFPDLFGVESMEGGVVWWRPHASNGVFDYS